MRRRKLSAVRLSQILSEPDPILAAAPLLTRPLPWWVFSSMLLADVGPEAALRYLELDGLA